MIDRRGFLVLSAAGAAAALGACTSRTPSADNSGKPVEVAFTAAESDVDLGGVAVRTWTYTGTVPATEIRLRKGQTLRVPVTNKLPQETSVHWHGLAIPNAMDGVPVLTQPAIAPGGNFTYEFAVPLRHDWAVLDGLNHVKDNLDGTFDFHARVSCSSGTYIRTLAEDFGKRLYVGAHLAELRRTRVGDLEITQAITLDQLKLHFVEESLGSVVLPLNAALSRLPFVHLNAEDVRRANHGRDVTVAEADWADGENVKMCDAGEQLIAVGQYDAKAKTLHPRVVLAEDKEISK